MLVYVVYRSNLTKQVLNTILDIQPKDGGGGGGLSPTAIVLNMTNDLQSKLPPDYKRDDVLSGIKVLGGMNKPLNICLKQEIDRLQKVLSVVRTMLANLKLAIAGTIIMSSDLQDASDAMFMARVPPAWTKVSALIAPNMGVWFGNILKRAEQLTGWLKNGRPFYFWLTGFFNASGFLTANRQEVCRKHAKEQWALDDVVNYSEVLRQERDEVRKGPDEGIYIYGLFLDGARWDKSKDILVDSEPKVIFAQLPVLWVTGTNTEKKEKGINFVTTPLYNAPKRHAFNFIADFDLRCQEAPSKWILRGVALMMTAE